jgi:predicted oxidoreductase
MKKTTLGSSTIQTGEIALGCMRMSRLSLNEAEAVVKNALELGINLFDHADIYGKGRSEEVFGKAVNLRSSIRDKMIIQSKCGIREGFYDFSEQHIIQSAESSLQRLGTDYLDVLLLHRPDVLMEPEETAEAFRKLKASGKVKYFGISNHNPAQIELLSTRLEEDLIINQMQLSLVHTPMIDHGFNVNMTGREAVNRDGQTIEYMRRNNMTLQAWSPFQHGMIEGSFLGNGKFPDINEELNEMAEVKQVSVEALAAAWLLRLPMSIQPVVGTMNINRLKKISQASNVSLSRQEWYSLYRAAGNNLP